MRGTITAVMAIEIGDGDPDRFLSALSQAVAHAAAAMIDDCSAATGRAIEASVLSVASRDDT
jgi:hypothetical protein